MLRRCRTLIRDQHEGHFSPRVQALLQRALRVRDRYRAGAISAHGVAVARGDLQNRLDVLIDQPGRRRIARNFATHHAIEFPAVFTFLLEPDAIDATNWRAEHALRSAVVTRKVCGGNRSARGAHPQEVLAGVLRTIHQRNLEADVILSQLLRSRQPTIALAPPPAVQ